MEMHPDDQSYDSIDDAMVCGWMIVVFQMIAFTVNVSGSFACYLSKQFQMLVMDFGAKIKSFKSCYN